MCLLVRVQDFGSPPLSGMLVATVMVAPIPPVFTQPIYTANILEFTGEVRDTTKLYFSIQFVTDLSLATFIF